MSGFIAQLESINLFKDVLVPACAALVSLWFAMRKFKRERLWQEKYEAYQRVLASIEVIQYWGNECSCDVYMLPSVRWFDGKKPHEFYAEAQREVARQCAIGTVLLSSDFVGRLTEFQTALFRKAHAASEDFHHDEQEAEFAFGEHATEVRKLADEYLSDLIGLARRDLGV